MRIKGYFVLSCLVFSPAAAQHGEQQNTVTDTEVHKVSEEISGMDMLTRMEFVELPVQIEQKLTENDFKVMKSLVEIQTGERQGSGVIYDEEEETGF